VADPFIGEIQIFAGNFAPRNWATCNGQTIPISQNSALFSIFGTTYGGDGRTTFAVPNLPGRFPMHAGHGPGLTNRVLGQTSGEATHTLTTAEVPSHSHQLHGDSGETDEEGQSDPDGQRTGQTPNTAALYGAASSLTDMNSATLTTVGGNGSHENLQPYLGIRFIVALQGVFPTRS